MTNLKSGLFVSIILGALCVILPNAAFAEVTSEQQMNECMGACNPVTLQEEKQACLTVDAIKDCFAKNDACQDWSEKLGTDVANYCNAYGERMCACGSKAPAKPSGATAPSKPSGKTWKPEGKERAVKLSEEEGCVAKGGVWVKETEERCEIRGDERVCQDYSRHYCFTLASAYEAIEALKKRVAELEGMPAMKLTEEDVLLIKQLKGFDFTKGFAAEHDWESERQKVLKALEAICSVSFDEEAKIRAELKEGEDILVAKCEVVRQKIADNEKRSKEALKKAGEAKETADEAKETADAAIKLAMPSLLRISAMGGAHFVRTHAFGDAEGDEAVYFGGVEVQWWHPITPKVALSLEGGLGYSSRIFDTNSVTSWLGIGLGTNLGPDVLGSAHLQASHFFTSDEWSKMNTYAIAPEITWVPGLSDMQPGDAAFALTLRLAGGVMRTNIEGVGTVQDPFAAGFVGLGVMF